MALHSIEQLIAGFRAFRAEHYEPNRAFYEALAVQGQAPRIMIVACADSRVDPLRITGAGLGDVFIVRNVANLVPPYAPDGAYHGTSAALEFAVRVLGVEHIVVMGHARCGGIQALVDGSPLAGERDDFVGAWMAIARPARARAEAIAPPGEGRRRACEHESIKGSLANLATFPWIKQRVDAGQLRLHGWYYDLAGARLTRLGAGGVFEDV
ncbi:MAG: carbonic anhydrase [Alphaproteobacteria bacterium]